MTDAEHWHDLAENAHASADRAATPEGRRSLLTIAESYHRLAEHAEHEESGEARLEGLYERHKARFGG